MSDDLDYALLRWDVVSRWVLVFPTFAAWHAWLRRHIGRAATLDNLTEAELLCVLALLSDR